MVDEVNSKPGPDVPGLNVAESEEFQAIQRLMHKRLVQICPGSLQSEVDDLVQEAMIKLIRMQQASDQPLEVSHSYIKRTAHSVMVDEIRKRQRRPELGTEAGGEADAVVAPASSSMASGTAGDAIRECLAEQLPERQRALTLHLLGHTLGEIADVLRCKQKRAENMVYRGIRALRDCLQLKGVHP